MAKLLEDAAKTTGVTGEASDTIQSQVDGQAPVDQNAETKTETEHKLSPKNKISRGVDPDTKTTWVPFNATPEENLRLRKVAAVRKVKVADLLAEVLIGGVKQYKDVFDADEAKYVGPATTTLTRAKKIEGMTPEELEKFGMSEVEKAQARVDAAKALIAQAKAKAEAAKLAKAQAGE